MTKHFTVEHLPETRRAVVGTKPFHNGDGYSWGGGTVLTIGDLAFEFGGGEGALIAYRLAELWNAALPPERT